MPTIAAPELTQFCEQILEGAGVPPHKAAITAECLVFANLRGVDSHGIQLLPFYIEQLLANEVDPQAEGSVLTESGACMSFDGENALGQVVADACCRHAIRMARDHGIALVTARESNHFGAAAFWAQKMRDAGQEVSLYRGALPMASSAALAAQLLGRHTSPTQAALRAERILRVQEALNALDPIDREVLALRHFEELDRAEAAQVLGISEAAAAKRYVRALKRLKEVLAELPGGLEGF